MAHQVVLNWIAPASGDPVVSYDVKRALVSGGATGPFVSIANPQPTNTTFTDTSVVASQEYVYEVCSVNGAGESVPCPSVTVTVPLGVPQPPTALTGIAS